MVNGIHARGDRKERLGRADVARRLLAPNVLLAGLQRHAKRAVAVNVLRHADDSPWQLAHVVVFAREVRGVRPAVTKRNAESLRASDRDVRAEFTRRREYGERENVGGHDGQCAVLFALRKERARVVEATVGFRILNDRRKNLRREVERRRVANDDANGEGVCARANDFDGRRVTCARDEDRVALVGAGEPVCEAHRFGGRGGFVEKRSVGDLEAGEVRYERLVIEKGLKATLGNFSLIGRVLRVPARILNHVAENDRGRDGAVETVADVAAPNVVHRAKLVRQRENLGFTNGRGNVESRVQANRAGHGFVDETRKGRRANGIEHLARCDGGRAQVPSGKHIRMRKRDGHDEPQ